MAFTIYPDSVNQYFADDASWSVARNQNGAELFDLDPTPVKHSITSAGVNEFWRTYMQFDLSSIVDPITSIQLYVNGYTTTGNTSYVVYGGQTPLSGKNDYQLYLNNLISGQPLSTIIIQNGYKSCALDITTYPPNTPAVYYIVGLVADNDFLNNTNATFDEVSIRNTLGTRPYLLINGGYANEVSGVLGVNITEVSGVPTANITDIMGV